MSGDWISIRERLPSGRAEWLKKNAGHTPIVVIRGFLVGYEGDWAWVEAEGVGHEVAAGYWRPIEEEPDG